MRVMYAILTGLIPMENLDLPLAEYAKALSISLVHTTARDVLTRKVRCLNALLFLTQIYIYILTSPLFLLCRNLCHVWEEGYWHQELQTDLSLIYSLLPEILCLAEKGMFVDDYVDSTTCWEWSFRFTKEFNLQYGKVLWKECTGLWLYLYKNMSVVFFSHLIFEQYIGLHCLDNVDMPSLSIFAGEYFFCKYSHSFFFSK